MFHACAETKHAWHGQGTRQSYDLSVMDMQATNFNLNSGLNLRAREDRLTQKTQLSTAKCQQLFLLCLLICYLTGLACQRFFDWSYEDRIKELSI
jgi:hypothetical protein